ncbi:MAG: hypothetical protein RLZZ219_1559 [Cyanobacteriota bacterium]
MPPSNPRRRFIPLAAALTCLAASGAAVAMAWTYSPEIALGLGNEAGWGEATTAYLLLAGGITALMASLACPSKKFLLAATGLCGLVGFNDETYQLARHGLTFRVPHQTVNASIDIFDSAYKTLDTAHILPFAIAAIIAYAILERGNPIRSFIQHALNQGGIPLLLLYILSMGVTAKLIDLGLLVKSGMASKPMSRVF